MTARASQNAAPDPAPLPGALLENLATRIGLSAQSHAVFGDPVTHDGVTVVPVAKVRWGFGGGQGVGGAEGGGGQRTAAGSMQGAGGGGGAAVSPIGYIELKDNQTSYKPIRDPISWVPLVLAGGAVGLLLLSGLRKLLRG